MVFNQYKQLLSILFVVLALAICSCTNKKAKQQEKPSNGGAIDSAGGNGIKVGADQLRQNGPKFLALLKGTVLRMEYFWNDSIKSPRSKNNTLDANEAVDIAFQAMLKGRRFSEPLVQSIDRLHLKFQTGPCSSKTGDHDASVNENGEVCLNVNHWGEISPDDQWLEMTAILLHELAHFRKTSDNEVVDEANAFSLQSWLIKNPNFLPTEDFKATIKQLEDIKGLLDYHYRLMKWAKDDITAAENNHLEFCSGLKKKSSISFLHDLPLTINEDILDLIQASPNSQLLQWCQRRPLMKISEITSDTKQFVTEASYDFLQFVKSIENIIEDIEAYAKLGEEFSF